MLCRITLPKPCAPPDAWANQLRRRSAERPWGCLTCPVPSRLPPRSGHRTALTQSNYGYASPRASCPNSTRALTPRQPLIARHALTGRMRSQSANAGITFGHRPFRAPIPLLTVARGMSEKLCSLFAPLLSQPQTTTLPHNVIAPPWACGRDAANPVMTTNPLPPVVVPPHLPRPIGRNNPAHRRESAAPVATDGTGCAVMESSGNWTRRGLQEPLTGV